MEHSAKPVHKFPVTLGVMFAFLLAIVLPACGFVNTTKATPKPTIYLQPTLVLKPAPTLSTTLSLDEAESVERAVIDLFLMQVEEVVLPQRQEFFRQWKIGSTFSAKPTQDADWVKVTVPNDSGGVDEWLFGGSPFATIAPANFGAVSMAILFFCTNRSDPKPDCRNWFEGIDSMVERIR